MVHVPHKVAEESTLQRCSYYVLALFPDLPSCPVIFRKQ